MNGSVYSIVRFSTFLIFFFNVLVPVAAAEESKLVGKLIFEVEYDDIKTPMRYTSDGDFLKVELGEEGDPYLVWIRNSEEFEGIAVLSPLQKKYSVEFDGPPMHDLLRSDGSIDKRRKPKEVILPEGKATEYKGFKCVQYNLDTDGPATAVWMLDNAQPLPFQVTQIWKTLYEASPHIVKLAERHQGIPLKIERKNWRGKIYFSMELSGYDATSPDKKEFTVPADYYQISSQVRGGRRVGQGGRAEERGSGR